MNTITVRERLTPAPARRVRVRALAVVGAAFVALAVWAAAVPLLGADLLVRPPGGSPQPVGPGSIVGASLIASALGWALLALLERRTVRARTIWTGLALVVVLLSLAGPLTAGTTAAGKVVLALMHLAVAALVIPALRRSSPTT